MFEQVTYKNFSPPHPLISATDVTLSWLLQLCPEDSTADALFQRVGNHYLCKIELSSKIGRFFADALDETPMQALDQAVIKIKIHLKTLKEGVLRHA